MDNFDVSVLEYLGKVDGGVLVLLSIIYDTKYYEATFFYNSSDILLTINQDLEDIVGDIKLHSYYQPLLKDILKKIVPYSEMYERLNDVDFSRWVEGFIDIGNDNIEVIDESEIKKDTK
jgi:hypothetical protein